MTSSATTGTINQIVATTGWFVPARNGRHAISLHCGADDSGASASLVKQSFLDADKGGSTRIKLYPP
jgi:hypothetical protein